MDTGTIEAAAPILLRYELSADDVGRAARVHARGLALRRPAVVTLLVVLAAVAAVEIVANPGDLRGLLLVVGGAGGGGIGAAIGLVLFAPVKARRLYRGNRLLRIENEMLIDAEAIRVTSEIAAATVPWQDVPRWREDRRVVLLYVSSLTYLVVPKRAMAPGDAERMRAYQAAGQRERPADGGEARGLSYLFAGGAEPPDPVDTAGAAPSADSCEPLAVSKTWITARADLVAAQRLALRRRWRRPRALVVPLATVLGAGLLSGSGLLPGTGALNIVNIAGLPLGFDGKVALGVAAYLVGLRVLTYAAIPLSLRNFRRKNPEFAYPYRVELDRAGMRTIMPNRDIRIAWADYVGWAEDRHVLLLYQSEALFQLVPTHAVDAHFLATFRELAVGLTRR